MKNYKIGDIIECNVTGIENYGIFVVVDEKWAGLIHISEISEGFVRDVNDYVKIGEKIKAKVLDVEVDESRLKLSIKNIEYRESKQVSYLIDAKNGFRSLKNNLNKWVEDKLKEIY